MKTVKLYTLGCKVNQYETQSIREQFLRAGFGELNNGLPADIYIINTCTVTHCADADSLNLIRRAKRENPQAKIIVTGCLTELDEGRIREVNADCQVVKNNNKGNILNFLPYFNQQTGKQTNQQTNTNKGISRFTGRTRAFLKIQDGCDNFCSYCKVPLVRGRSRSRPLNEIVAEARRLAGNGFKEIVLTGICLGSYSRPGRNASLIDLISALEDIDGLLRIRLSSIEAGDVSDGLIEKMAKSKKLCPHLHIPVQSGDDEILKKMNRKYTRQSYLGLVRKIKSRVPGIAITTDVLVGFPGESQTNFNNTVKLLKAVQPLKVHIFPYSAREKTPACAFEGRIGPEVVRARIMKLEKIAGVCARLYIGRWLNKDTQALIEGRSGDRPDFWEGYTANYLRVLVKSRRNLKNQLVGLKFRRIIKKNDALEGIIFNP